MDVAAAAAAECTRAWERRVRGGRSGAGHGGEMHEHARSWSHGPRGWLEAVGCVQKRLGCKITEKLRLEF